MSFAGTLETKQQKHQNIANGSTFSCINLHIWCSATWQARLRNEEEESGQILLHLLKSWRTINGSACQTQCCFCLCVRAKPPINVLLSSFYIYIYSCANDPTAVNLHWKALKRRSLDADCWPMKQHTSLRGDSVWLRTNRAIMLKRGKPLPWIAQAYFKMICIHSWRYFHTLLTSAVVGSRVCEPLGFDGR